MKIKISLSIIVVLLVVILFRGLSHYPDKQYHHQGLFTPVVIDEQKVTQRFAQSIQIATVSRDEAEDSDKQAFIEFRDFLTEKFPLIAERAEQTIINDYSLVYQFAGSNSALKPVLFMGHMDVVSVDESTLDKWRFDPFSGTIADEMVWGRGAIDDKATVMALMEAMELTLSQGKSLERTIYFAFGHDEEIGGKQGAANVAKHFEEQGIQFEFVLDEGGLVLEQGMMPNVNGQVAVIGVAEKGFVNIELSVEQDGGHSSAPPANTGAGILAQAIVKLENNPFPSELTYTNLTFDKLGYYADFPAKIVMANQWLTEPILNTVLKANPKTAASIRTTTAVTMLSGSSKSNVLPSKATAVVNFRIMPGQTSEYVANYVEEVIDDPRVELRIFMASEPSPMSTLDSMGFEVLEQTIRAFDNDILVAPYLVQGGTDSHYFYNVSDAIYRFIMVRTTNELLKGMHGINERLAIEDYVMGIQYFHEIIRKVSIQSTEKSSVSH